MLPKKPVQVERLVWLVVNGDQMASVKDVEPYWHMASPIPFFEGADVDFSLNNLFFSTEFLEIQLKQPIDILTQNCPYPSAWFGALGWWAQIPSSTRAPIRKLPRCLNAAAGYGRRQKNPPWNQQFAPENWGLETLGRPIGYFSFREGRLLFFLVRRCFSSFLWFMRSGVFCG